MTETTNKKTVAKASAGKQVKASPEASPEKSLATGPEQAAAKSPVKAAAKPKPTAVAKPITAAAAPRSNSKPPNVTVSPHRSRDFSPDVVASKAYEIYSREGHQHGRDQDHWFRAEEELRNVLV